MCQLHYKLAEGSPNELDSQGCHWTEPFKDQKHLGWSIHHGTERARRNGDWGWMTLHRLIRELQVDEWVSWKAWLQKSWQGDPGGQAMSRRHRGWREKGTCHRGEPPSTGRQEARREQSETAWGQEQEFPNLVDQEPCPCDVPRSHVSPRVSLASSVTRS